MLGDCAGIRALSCLLGLHPANERRRYKVTQSLFDWAQTSHAIDIGDNWLSCLVANTKQIIYFEALWSEKRKYKKRHLHHMLTHWGRVTHICVGKLSIIGSDNGLSPGRRQAIIRTNAGILLIGPLGTNFSEKWIGIETFSIKEMHLKMSSAKWRLFGLGLNVLRQDDVMTWTRFPLHNWPFVRGIHRSPEERFMFSLLFAERICWTKSLVAGDLRRHYAHCDLWALLQWIFTNQQT